MKVTLAIPIYNQLNDCKGILALFRHNTSEETEFLIIDNGSTDPVEDFVQRQMKPKRLNFIRNKENLGMVKTLQQMYENCDTDILVITHNDVFIYEKDWDKRIAQVFEANHNIGVLGLFGSQGCGERGERYQDVPVHLAGSMAAGFSNMLEAEIHGLRLHDNLRACSILDGFFLAINMKLLKQTNGFDQRYQFHHYYDRDISLESLRHGYSNFVVNIPSHHLSGLTANRGDYQKWVREKVESTKQIITESGDQWAHDHNMELFLNKWRSATPLYIQDDGSFRSGGIYNFKGDAITKLST